MAQSVLQPAGGDANAANGKSMADDSKLRVPGEPYRRTAERGADDSFGSDPLTELARLIGKNDPYAEFGRSGSREDERQHGYARSESARDDWQLSSAREHYDERYDEGHEEARPESYGSGRDSYAPNADLPLTPRVSDWRSDHAPSYDEEPHPDHDQDGQSYGDEDLHARLEDHEDDQRADLGVSADHQEEQSYDDPPRAYRHGGLATALALIGCAILGTAGAYAYRSYFGQPGLSQPPPVITADTGLPSKIVPAPAGDAQSGKSIQDRVANATREQVVSKQEEPVALKDLGTQGAPRAVSPTPPAPAPGPSAVAPSAPAAPSGTEPRKVRTVTIRPDGGDASGRQATAPAAPGAAPAPRAATPAPKNGPLSLDPQAQDSAPPPAPRTRTATAPVGSTGSSGGFLVQLSSQKTEADATSSFRSLQAKFPNELGGRQAVIRRADLGTKGVFYRTMVGPFGSAQEANQFCASYKAAGGTCVVPNN